MDELEDPFWTRQITQTVVAEIDDTDLRGENIANELLGRGETTIWPPCPAAATRCCLIDGRSVVVATTFFGHPGVDADAHPQRQLPCPRLRGEARWPSTAASTASPATLKTA